ncbi:MAG TPA: hypothetical protein VGR98_25995 [Streptosporangiaceae bacterium]|nr:hypothetical protein [Streptosporangiaceae bacterium]
MDTFADVVLARADDEAVGVVSDHERLTWAEVVQEAAGRAAFLSGMSSAGPTSRPAWYTPSRTLAPAIR